MSELTAVLRYLAEVSRPSSARRDDYDVRRGGQEPVWLGWSVASRKST